MRSNPTNCCSYLSLPEEACNSIQFWCKGGDRMLLMFQRGIKQKEDTSLFLWMLLPGHTATCMTCSGLMGVCDSHYNWIVNVYCILLTSLMWMGETTAYFNAVSAGSMMWVQMHLRDQNWADLKTCGCCYLRSDSEVCCFWPCHWFILCPYAEKSRDVGLLLLENMQHAIMFTSISTMNSRALFQILVFFEQGRIKEAYIILFGNIQGKHIGAEGGDSRYLHQAVQLPILQEIPWVW